MKIQIGGLSEGIHQYGFTVPASDLDLGDQFAADVDVEATLDKTSNQILLTAKLTVMGDFVCDRCIGSFQRKLAPSYTMLYALEGSEPAHLDPSEFQIMPPGLHIIDIAEDIRQSILLAVPLKLLCRETCKGLCPSCGQNLNEGECSCKSELTDSRWEKLRKFGSA